MSILDPGTSTRDTTVADTGKTTSSPSPVFGSTAPALSTETTPIALSPQLMQSGTAFQIVQTAGSLGSSELVQAYMSKLQQIASNYTQSDPATYNALIQLGLKGKEMATAIAACDNQCTDTGTNQTQRTTVESLTSSFLNTWNWDVYNSGIYNKLSPTDQSLIQAITQQSASIGAATVPGNSWPNYSGLSDIGPNTAIDPAQVVNTNSDTTIRCGTNGTC